MSFFRTFIDRPIQEELFSRIDAINFNKSPQGPFESIQSSVLSSVQHQFVKSCWARASVVLGEGEVVSLNTNLNDDQTPANEPLNIRSNKQPYRGRPGIVSISSSFKEYFLKTSTINYFVPDPEEFNLFKNRFLKFGRYILVEFGWSLPYNLKLPALSGESVLQISRDLKSRVIVGKGNYNALVGVVTNYTFDQTKEGAYEGTIEISSMGHNILGQKSDTDGKVENLVGYVNKRLEEVDASKTDDKELSAQEKDIYKTLRKTFVNFHSVIKNLGHVVEEYINENPTDHSFTAKETKVVSAGLGATDTKEEDTEYDLQGRPGVLYINESSIFKNQDRPTYLTWGWFEDYILNSFFSFTSESDNVNFKTEFRSATTEDTIIKKRQTDYIQNQQTIRGQLPIRDVETNEITDYIPSALTRIEVDVIGSDVSRPGLKYINNKCGTHPSLYSLGFDSIILPGKTKVFEITNKSTSEILNRKVDFFRVLTTKINEIFPPFETQDKNGITRGQIRNMVFNVNYLKESFEKTTNIEKSINMFWQKVSNDYGGFWRFSITEDNNYDGRIMVNDLNIGIEDDTNVINKLSTKEDPDKIFKFPVYSKDSIVTDFSITSENSAEMATMAVYGSNTNLEATSADMGKGYTALAMRALSSLDNVNSVSSGSLNDEQNKAFYDSILNNLSNPVYGNFVNQGSFEGSAAIYDAIGNIKSVFKNQGIEFDKLPKIIEDAGNIEDELTETNLYETDNKSIREAYFWFDEADTKVQIYNSRVGKMYDEFKRTMLFLINKAPGEESNYSTVLPVVPIQLSLTLQGIGGIKVGDLFYIDYLPKLYREYCHFMVVNVDHEISTTGWTTKLDSRMVIDIPKLIKEKQISQVTKFEPYIVKDSLSQKVKELVKLFEAENVLATEGIKRKNINAGRAFFDDLPNKVPKILQGRARTYAAYGNFVADLRENILERKVSAAAEIVGVGQDGESTEVDADT